MKKIMILLAAAAMTMACAGNEVEKQAEQYIQQMFEALANEDLATVMTIGQEVEEWEASLDEKDKAKAEEAAKAAAEKWIKENLSEEEQANFPIMW